MFVDETKDHGFVMVAAVVPSAGLARVRKIMRGLVMPGQRRIHFHKESDARRKQILDVIDGIGPQLGVYDASAAPRKQRRDACLRAVVEDAVRWRAEMLVIERDDSVLEADRRLLYRAIRQPSGAVMLRYEFPRGHEEPLLAIPDAVAWCWNRGGHWWKRAREMVTVERALDR